VATLTFDRILKEMRISAPDLTVGVVEIYSQSRDYESQLSNMDLPQLVKAGGKEPLGLVLGFSVFVGITMTLTDDWHVGFDDRGGPATEVADINGGNTLGQVEVADDPAPTFQNPIAPTTFVTITRTNSSSATLLTANIDAQAAQVAEMWALLGLDVSNPLVVTKTTQDAGAGISQTITGDGENTSTVTRNP
jgi:hypothetical protein